MEANTLLENYIVFKDGTIKNKITGRYLKPDLSSLYPRIVLSKNKVKRKFLIHQLVALIYIPNPEDKPCVNHINGIKTDNRVENLEWCTYSENEIHSRNVLGKKTIHSENTKTKIGFQNKGKRRTDEDRRKMSLKRKGIPAKNRIPIVLNDNIKFESIAEASNRTGLSDGAIRNNLNGISKITKVGLWKYQQKN